MAVYIKPEKMYFEDGAYAGGITFDGRNLRAEDDEQELLKFSVAAPIGGKGVYSDCAVPVKLVPKYHWKSLNDMSFARSDTTEGSYTLVTYTCENMFDAIESPGALVHVHVTFDTEPTTGGAMMETNFSGVYLSNGGALQGSVSQVISALKMPTNIGIYQLVANKKTALVSLFYPNPYTYEPMVVRAAAMAWFDFWVIEQQ